MIVRRINPSRSRSGLMLVDLLIYISLLALVLVLAAVVFNDALTQSGHLARNISDIERAMKAGELWRADVRSATGPPQIKKLDGFDFFVIPTGTNEVAYSFQSNRVYRFKSVNGQAEIAAPNVKSMQVVEEKREFAAGWRWELELERRRRNAHVRPLFTFMAVPERR